jgi:hypothetical protein
LSKTRKQEDAEYFAEIEANLSLLHDETNLIQEWKDNKDVFLRNLLELIQASYEAGYDSGLYDVHKAVQELGYAL